MYKFCVGDIVKLKINSELDNLYYFSKKNNQVFVILSLSVSEKITNINEDSEVIFNLKLISFIEFLKFQKSLINYINITGLPSYNSKNFYKIDRRLILEKKEEAFISKVMSR
jgi:hypothetical protein